LPAIHANLNPSPLGVAEVEVHPLLMARDAHMDLMFGALESGEAAEGREGILERCRVRGSTFGEEIEARHVVL